jgi:hypothetical protein
VELAVTPPIVGEVAVLAAMLVLAVPDDITPRVTMAQGVAVAVAGVAKAITRAVVAAVLACLGKGQMVLADISALAVGADQEDKRVVRGGLAASSTGMVASLVAALAQVLAKTVKEVMAQSASSGPAQLAPSHRLTSEHHKEKSCW